jgi:4-amino-4-deoxy-L-arabinose transferase-like glycosyltransferase
MSPRHAAGIAALALLLRLPVFLQPFWSGDEATYAALGNALLRGDAMYAQAVDHKPPLTALTYAGVLGLFGRDALGAVHVLSIAVVAATGVLLTVAGQGLGLDPRAAAAAGLASVIFTSVGPPQDALAGNAELFLLLPATAALALAATAADRRRRWLAAGLLASTAALYKYQGAAVLLPLGFLAIRRGRLAALTLGALLPPALLVGWYAGADQLPALRFWAWTYPLRYATSLGAADALRRGLRGTLAWSALCAVPLIAAGVSPRDTRTQRLALAWLAASALAVSAGGRYFLHYFLQLVPPLALLAAPALCSLPRASRRPKLLATLGVVLPCALTWAMALLDARVRPRVAAQTVVYREVGAYLDAHADPAARLFVWGNSPELYHFARRDLGTRFPFCNHLSGKIWGTAGDEPDAPDAQLRPVAEAWPMLLEDLALRRPAWIADAAKGGLDRWEGHAIARYPALREVVARDYDQVATVEGVDLYRRRSP